LAFNVSAETANRLILLVFSLVDTTQNKRIRLTPPLHKPHFPQF